MNKETATHSFTVFPNDLNYFGTLYGGTLMSHMDLAGVQVVRRATYGTGADGCVTASVDKIDFHRPAFLGDLIVLVATIKTIGKSSIQVQIKVTRESTIGETEEICTANFTFVTMKDKKPFKHNLTFEKLTNGEL
jgi:acyl-CoA hydrolase